MVSNGMFPSTCANTAAGGSCTATCSQGFSGSPTVACVLNPSAPSGAAWSTTVTGSCTAGRGFEPRGWMVHRLKEIVGIEGSLFWLCCFEECLLQAVLASSWGVHNSCESCSKQWTVAQA
jgi:hypothetical protein